MLSRASGDACDVLLSPGKTLDQSLDGRKGRIYVVQTSGLKGKRLKVKASRSSRMASDLCHEEGREMRPIFLLAGSNALEVDNARVRTARILAFDLDQLDTVQHNILIY